MIYNQHNNTQYHHLADLLMILYDNLRDDLLMCIKCLMIWLDN